MVEAADASTAGLPKRWCSESSLPDDSEESRAATLHRGVQAIVGAMAGEVQFTNENEEAFGLFRRGCRQCAQLPATLEAVDPKATIVAFLVRSAARRSAERQLQELGSILAQTASWHDLLSEAPEPLQTIIARVLSDVHPRDMLTGRHVLLGRRQAVEQTLCELEPHQDAGWNLPVKADPCKAAVAPPADEARVFLRERVSQRYLTIAEYQSAECCMMTETVVSLFVCHHSCSSESGDANEDADDSKGMNELAHGVELGFEHEGVPALGRFLTCRRSWLPRGDPELSCKGWDLSRNEEFHWHPDATIQHVNSGRWLYVDPDAPDKVAMHLSTKSSWEVLPAL